MQGHKGVTPESLDGAVQRRTQAEKLAENFVSPLAEGARLLICITFHFRHARLGYLSEVLRSLSGFRVANIEVVVITNSTDHDQLELLRRLYEETVPGMPVSVRTYKDLSHPKELTWCHKEIISEEFGGTAKRRFTHFIYLEDD